MSPNRTKTHEQKRVLGIPSQTSIKAGACPCPVRCHVAWNNNKPANVNRSKIQMPVTHSKAQVVRFRTISSGLPN